MAWSELALTGQPADAGSPWPDPIQTDPAFVETDQNLKRHQPEIQSQASVDLITLPQADKVARWERPASADGTEGLAGQTNGTTQPAPTASAGGTEELEDGNMRYAQRDAA